VCAAAGDQLKDPVMNVAFSLNLVLFSISIYLETVLPVTKVMYNDYIDPTE